MVPSSIGNVASVISATIFSACVVMSPLLGAAEQPVSDTMMQHQTNVKVTPERFQEVVDTVDNWQIRCRKANGDADRYWRCNASNGQYIRKYRTKNEDPIVAFINNKDKLQLKGLNQNLYVVQVAAFLNEVNAKRYIKSSPVSGLVIRKTLNNGKHWYNVTSDSPLGYRMSKEISKSLDIHTVNKSWIRKMTDFQH